MDLGVCLSNNQFYMLKKLLFLYTIQQNADLDAMPYKAHLRGVEAPMKP